MTRSNHRENRSPVKGDTAIVRDERGKFVPGTAAGPGRTSRRTLTEALRSHIDPDEAARLIWERAVNAEVRVRPVGRRTARIGVSRSARQR